ncbi:MAG: hypothetical protein LBQ44_10025 [Treponema sp.]|jgi:hypothetical protein|nr:hypothetical protein [Treponema sp.]
MNLIKRSVLPCFFLLLASLLGARNNQGFPSLEADPRAREFADRAAASSGGPQAAGGLWRTLAEAALWASSVNAGAGAEQKAAACMDRINAAASELASAPDLPADARARGEYVLTFIHRRFLKSYSEYQTRLDEIFVSGRYNCVSSAVLYLVLGLSAGLDVGGVMTRDHAFATVNTPSGPVDAETTNPYGFDPGNKKEFQDAFGKATGFAYVPARNYRDRAVINGLELVSLILSNRISVLERANRFAEAVPLAINRAVLLSRDTGAAGHTERAAFFEDPYSDMITRMMNYGASLLKAGREKETLAWVDYASPRYDGGGRWQELNDAALNNQLVRLIRNRKAGEARAVLNAEGARLSREKYAELDGTVLEAEAAERINGLKNPGEAETILAWLAETWNRLPEKKREEMRSTTVLKEAERFGRLRDWSAAIVWLNASLEKYGPDKRVENALRTFRQNRVGELHNEFASFYNKKDFAGARAAVLRALEEFPGERQLSQDLNMAERALQQ